MQGALFGRAAAILILSLVLPALVLPALGRAEMVRRDQGGLTVTGELVEAGGGLDAGVVLMVHGTFAHHRMELMRGLQDRFAERGLSSLAVTLSLGVDQRQGMIDCAVPHRHRHDDAAAEIGGWLEWLKARTAGPVTLLGHSRGGNQVAWYLNGQEAAPVARAVLLAPSTGEQPDGAEAMLALAAGKPDDALIDVPAFLYCGPGQATAGAVRAYYAGDTRHDTLSLLAGIRQPVLVFAASDDTVVPNLLPRMRALESKAPAGVRVPGFQVIDDSDHFFRDFAADDVADAVAAFIGQ